MTVITPNRMIVEDSSNGPCGPHQTLWISEAGGLTQFGALIQVLPPGSRSSIKHWHSAEDEMIYVLEGHITLIEGETETLLKPGDAATFRAGDSTGHCLENRSDRATPRPVSARRHLDRWARTSRAKPLSMKLLRAPG